MRYFINKEENTIIGYDGANIYQFDEIEDGEEEAPKRTYRKKKKVKSEDSGSNSAGPATQSKRLTPEIIKQIKDDIEAETPIPEIAEKYGVPVANIYYYKRGLQKKNETNEG